MRVWTLAVLLAMGCSDNGGGTFNNQVLDNNQNTTNNTNTTGSNNTTGLNNTGSNNTTGSNNNGTNSGADMGVEPDANADVGMDQGPPPNPLEGVGDAVLVQEGFLFTEGPKWFPDEGVLRFTDIPANTIFELGTDGTITSYRNPSGQANGLAFNANGALLAAEHENRRVSITVDGQPTTLVDRYNGQRLNSPNDLVLRSDGVIYFTDPPYGLGNRQREVNFNGLYRYVPTTQALTAEYEGDANATRPNGVTLSPDENTLYMADTQAGKVYQYTVAPDGALSDRLEFADVSGPDGMAIDVWGNLYVTGGSGVEVFAPDGIKLGTINVGRQPANCAFGGADGKTLYITARQGLYKVELPVQGVY